MCTACLAAVVANSTSDEEYANDTRPRAQSKSIVGNKTRERFAFQGRCCGGRETPAVELWTGTAVFGDRALRLTS